jgi:SWI/SNF-related matrix-associated actin-dependent regulator 1 of chromatin subfamily A
MIKKYKFDFSPKTAPFAHQTEAVEFIRGNKAVPLFDEQGLGKTKVVIDALCQDMEDGLIDGALVICRKYLLPNWEDEIQTHSHLKSITFTGTKQQKGNKFMVFSHFYLINYESLMSELERIKMFLKVKKLAIVLDESQKIKNPDSKTTKCVFAIKSLAAKRIIVTGTPVANKPEDLWAQFYFLDDGQLLGGDFNQFKEKYGIELKGEEPLGPRVAKLGDLKEVINRVSIRRLKDQVLELPEKRFQDVEIILKGKQKELYEKLKDELYVEIKNLEGPRIIDESSNILKKLLRLTQLASNPALLDDDYNETPSKFTKLDELVKDLINKGEKLIVWTSFTGNVRLLRRRYKDYGALMIFGEIPMEKRKIVVRRFKEDEESKILIANAAAAREGLTLTSANNAIYLDRNFNLVDYLQSQDRIHRISQTKPCNIVKIIAKDTVDQYIDEILYKKQKVAQFLQGDIEEIQEEKEYLTKEEIIRILGGR